MTQQRLDAWLLSDGLAGNVRQARALAHAAGWAAQEWTLRARAPWIWASPRQLPGADGAFGDAFAHAIAGDLRDVIAVGCGRQAALATRLMRERGARAVQILDPRLDVRHWDLVIAPEHDGLRGENVITLRGSLHPVDDAWLAAARDAHAQFAELPAPRTAILLGGTSAHAQLDAGFFDTLLRQLQVRASHDGGSVLATASRRTPVEVAARLQTLLSGVPGVVWSGPAQGPNPYPGLLGWADRIVCTADSVNMLSEAAATRVPLWIAGAAQLSGRPRHFVEALLASGRARCWNEDFAPYAVEPLRETARIAAEVRRRLGFEANSVAVT